MTVDPFTEYLNQPCDQPDCDETATHNQGGGKWCNRHTDRDLPAFARND